MADGCLFCQIVSGETPASIVFQDDFALAFLDHRPLFPGHCLLIPKAHIETLGELPASSLEPLFGTAQSLAGAMERGLEADGTFVAINNKVSQSVPHLHVHVVPRTKGDGLRGFFWPRHRYASEEEAAEYARRIREALAGAAA